MQKHFVVLSLLLVAACGPGEFAMELDEDGNLRADAERWSKQDAPSLFGLDLQYSLRALPLEGKVTTSPWVGSYWPVVRDSINYRWDRRAPSAAEKYRRAFNSPYNIEGYVSANHGVDSFSGGGYCTSDSECGRGSGCGRRSGSGAGKCIPNWWGICDAWAAAAILTPEPLHAVTYNKVLFNVADIKALVTLVHKRTEARHVALRCYSNGVNVDGAGRPRDPSCRDANPGTYHLLLANLVGLGGTTFIEDRSTDMDVWNHPVTSFYVKTMQPVTEMQANAKLGIGNAYYPYNGDAKRLVYVETDVTIMKEDFITIDGHLDPNNKKYFDTDTYKYILELDAQARIIGGEWVQDSKWRHPDFLWLPLRARPEFGGAGGKIEYEKVMNIARASWGRVEDGESRATTNPSRPGQGRERPRPNPPAGEPMPNPETPENPVPQPEPPAGSNPPAASNPPAGDANATTGDAGDANRRSERRRRHG